MVTRRIGAAALAIAVTLTAPAGIAQAGKGSLKDPRGGTPDIVKLSFNNAKSKVVITTKYADISEVTSESQILTWGKGKSYQAFNSPVLGTTQLKFFKNTGVAGDIVPCPKLKVVRNAAKNRTTATIPRSCLKKAPNKLRFRANAIKDFVLFEETKTSRKVKRG